MLVKWRWEIGGAEDMVGNDVLQQIEPEERKLREDAPLVGNRRGQNDVKGRKAVRRDDQQLVAEIVDVPHLPARGGRQTGETGFSNNADCRARRHRIGSPDKVTSILTQRNAKSTERPVENF